MKILHFSDVHLDVPPGVIPAVEWAGKRFLGGANLLLRRRRHYARAREKLALLAALAEREGVDLAVCTGDYTALGTEPELAAARRAVEPFRRLRWGLVTVPGNHDLYTERGLADGRFERHFGDLLQSDLPDAAVDGPWPIVKLCGDSVAVVGVNSARPNPAPWVSSGAVPGVQLAALRDLLARAELEGRFVLVITHYAPRLEHGGPDSRRHGLDNADDFLAAVGRLSSGALLFGHVHRCFTVRVPELRVPLYGAGSTTMEQHEGGWLFEVGAACTARRLRFRQSDYALDPPQPL